MMDRRIAVWFLIVLIFGAVVSTFLPLKARAHDPYSLWKDRRGFLCCDQRDCAPVRADLTPDGWRVWADGRWMVVSPDAVLAIPSPDGRSHACWTPGAVEPRCFVAGEVRG